MRHAGTCNFRFWRAFQAFAGSLNVETLSLANNMSNSGRRKVSSSPVEGFPPGGMWDTATQKSLLGLEVTCC